MIASPLELLQTFAVDEIAGGECARIREKDVTKCQCFARNALLRFTRHGGRLVDRVSVNESARVSLELVEAREVEVRQIVDYARTQSSDPGQRTESRRNDGGNVEVHGNELACGQ